MGYIKDMEKQILEAVEKNLGNFKYDPNDKTWKFGTMKNGIGIYSEDEFYFGNICLDSDLTIGYGPYDTLNQAKMELLKHFIEAELRSEY